jgi:6-phosphogluconate dehydrogenase (decarboxylating)
MITNGHCIIVLPDNKKLNARIGLSLLSIEDMSQVQPYVAKVRTKLLPEGMNVKVLIPKRNNEKCKQIISKSALQSDETMQQFWIMKVVENKAVKVPVDIGRSNQTEVEILSPCLSASDVIVDNGAYALTDGAFVKIVNKQ